MAPRNNQPFEILERKNSKAHTIAGAALAENRFVLKDGYKKWDIRLAAQAVMGCVTTYSPLWREAKLLHLLATGRWDPKSARAVLGSRRKVWNQQQP